MMIAIAIIIVVALAVAGGYFYIMNKTGDANPLSALQKTTASYSLNPNCDYKDPDLCKFLNNWTKQTNYTMTLSSSGAKGSTVFQIDGNNTHSKISADNQTYETITIGDTTYTKDTSDNKWWKQKSSTDDSTTDDFKFDVPSATASAEDKTTFTKDGKEACGKLTCFKYMSMTGSNQDSMEELWFDDSQYLLRKMESTSTNGTTTVEYNYDKVSLTAPSPVKEATAKQTILPNGQTMDSGMTQEQMDAMQKMMDQSSSQ